MFHQYVIGLFTTNRQVHEQYQSFPYFHPIIAPEFKLFIFSSFIALCPSSLIHNPEG